MSDPKITGRRARRLVLGVVAGWQVYERTTPNWYLDAVLRGVVEEAGARGCDALLSCGVDAQIEEPRHVRPGWPVPGDEEDFVPVGPWNTDALLFISPLRTAKRRLYALGLQEAGFPVAFVGAGDGTPAVVGDGASGLGAALAHLRAHGHRAVAFVSGDPMDQGDSLARLIAFRRLRSELGLDTSEDLVAPGLHSERGGYHAMRAILGVGHPFTAVLASNDTSAIGAMHALAEEGLGVPDDVAVVGFDDQPTASASVPPLATITYPLAEAGRRAVGLLLDVVRGESRPGETIAVPTRLVKRRSCGCLHRDASTAGADVEIGPEVPEGDAALAMVRSLDRARPKLPPATVLELCRRLETSLTESATTGSPRAFEAALRELMQRVEAGGDRAQRWHAALSALRLCARRRLSPESLDAAEDLLHLARVALSESADRQDSRQRAYDSRQGELVSALTVPLQSAQTEGEILEILAEHGPALGVRPVCLALYEPSEEGPVAWSRVLPLLESVGPGRRREFRVRTERLRPRHLPARREPWRLAVVPLVRQGSPLGFLACETATLAPVAAVARQLAVALESVRLQAAVRALTLTDEVTGLHNRRFFERELKREVERARRFDRELALVLLDIDHFKHYNDTFGHRAGDEALRGLAAHLAGAVPRRLDAVARYGGEEFAVLLAETDLDGARLVAERIRESVQESREFRGPLTISAGVAVAEGAGCEAEALFLRADGALYQAKRDGRNCVRVASGD